MIAFLSRHNANLESTVETEFTPIASLVGGILIGLAALMLMVFIGRIAGAMGILAGVFFPSGSGDWLWRAAFIAGMISAPTLATIAAIPGYAKRPSIS